MTVVADSYPRLTVREQGPGMASLLSALNSSIRHSVIALGEMDADRLERLAIEQEHLLLGLAPLRKVRRPKTPDLAASDPAENSGANEPMRPQEASDLAASAHELRSALEIYSQLLEGSSKTVSAIWKGLCLGGAIQNPATEERCDGYFSRL